MTRIVGRQTNTLNKVVRKNMMDCGVNKNLALNMVKCLVEFILWTLGRWDEASMMMIVLMAGQQTILPATYFCQSFMIVSSFSFLEWLLNFVQISTSTWEIYEMAIRKPLQEKKQHPHSLSYKAALPEHWTMKKELQFTSSLANQSNAKFVFLLMWVKEVAMCFDKSFTSLTTSTRSHGALH